MSNGVKLIVLVLVVVVVVVIVVVVVAVVVVVVVGQITFGQSTHPFGQLTSHGQSEVANECSTYGNKVRERTVRLFTVR